MRAVVHAASAQARHDRGRARQALDALFRTGEPPSPALDGRLAGRLVMLDIAPGLDPLADRIAAAWMPWKGKTFDPRRQCGDNVFDRGSLPAARLLWPFYRGVVEGADTYRAFEFRTYQAPGLFDPDRSVLKIDYDSRANPGLTVRRVLDELVQLAGGLYLGKAHLKWWWGRWQTVAYFTLEATLPS